MMAQSKDASAASNSSSRVQAWRSEVGVGAGSFRRYMDRSKTEARQESLKEEYIQWCSLVKVTKKARWHSTTMTKLTQRFITYKLHHSRGKDESGVETCMSWTDLKTLARDLRDIVEAEIDTQYVHESEVIQFDIGLKWHIHRICKQLPVRRPFKPPGIQENTARGVVQQGGGDDEGYDSWEESPSAEDLRVDWTDFAEEEKEEEEPEPKEYKIEVGEDEEVKVKPTVGGGRKGSGLRNVFIADTVEDAEDTDATETSSTIEISLGDVASPIEQSPPFGDETSDKASIKDPTKHQPEEEVSNAGVSRERLEQDNILRTTDESQSDTRPTMTSDTYDQNLTKPSDDIISPTSPTELAPSPSTKKASVSSLSTTLILTTPHAASSQTHTRPLDETHDRPSSFGMDHMSVKRRKIC